MNVDDAKLTEHGLQGGAAEADKTLLLACGALAREILSVLELNNWQHMDLACLPAKLHNEPHKIPELVRAKVREARSKGYRSISVVFADCGTGGLLDKVCAEEDVTRIEGPHCYSFFDGNAAFAERAEAGEFTAFYLTDFLARQFDTLIWKGMGLDRYPDLLPMMFGHYEKIIYLAQTVDPTLEVKARAAAERLGLAFEMRMTGYGELAGFLRTAAEETTGSAPATA